MNSKHRLLPLLASLLLAIGLCGCATLPLEKPLPPPLHMIGLPLRSPQGAAMAWHPDGNRLAVVGDTLALLDIATKRSVTLSSEAPTALAWADNGTRLAAAFAQPDDSRIAVMSPDGDILAEVNVPGRVYHLLWHPDHGIIATAVELENLAIGVRVVASLVRWDGAGVPQVEPLHSVIVRPSTLQRWGNLLLRNVSLALSPLGDEILYARMHEPPANLPHLRIILRHLQTGAEREIARATLDIGSVLFMGDGDEVLFGDGMVHTHWINAWTGEALAAIPVPGHTVAASGAGKYIMADGHLFAGDALLAEFPDTSEALFSPRGDRLVVRHDGRLYLLSGLDEPAMVQSPLADKQRLLELRKWRAEGLISTEEYTTAKQGIEAR